MAPRRNRHKIWGYFMNSTSEHDSDNEDSDSVSDDEALDLDDIEASSDGTIARSVPNKLKTMFFHLYDNNETIRVRGRFNMSDPWWAARMTVVKNNDFWELCGNVAYYLRQDNKVVGDKVVPLFLTSCEVHPDHLQVFTEAVRSLKKTNQLTFQTLPGMLEEFAAMSETNKDVAGEINSHIIGNGAMVTCYTGLELFYEFIPQLLPKKFKSFVEMKWFGSTTLEELQVALKDEPWVFGYDTVIGKRFHLYSCEATLAAYTSSGLIDRLSPVQQDSLYIYDTLKACCRRSGHTFVADVKLRRNYRPACMHTFEDWDAAMQFLVDEEIVKLQPSGSHQRVYRYRLWKAEQHIALGIHELFRRHSDDPWDLGVDFDSAQFKDIWADLDQLKAAGKIVAKPVVVISGAGGCGKTHVVSKVFHHVQHQRYVKDEFDQADVDDFTLCHMTTDEDTSIVTPENLRDKPPTPNRLSTSQTCDFPRILLSAPTGKVANLLGQRSQMPGYTLHQVIYSFRYRQNKPKTDLMNPKEEWKFSLVEVLITDECSLVSVKTFATVLDMLLKYAKLRKLVLLGDVKQLPSIEPGNFLADMYTALWNVDCSIMLSTNHRSESQLIVNNAVRISQRQCPIIDQERRFCQTTIAENRYDSTEYPECDRDAAIRKLLEEQQDLYSHETSQFVSFRRRDCEAINELCSRHYCGHAMFEKIHGRRRRLFVVGDKVCCSKNGYVKDHLNPDKMRRLCNGEIFFIRRDRTIQGGQDLMPSQHKDPRKTIRLLLLDDLSSKCEVDMRDLQKCGLRHSWARTIHTFQGSEMNTVVYVVGPASCQTWQHVYTAVTRGRNRIILVTCQSDLSIAVSRQPQRRNTSLQEKMGEKLKDLGEAATAVQSEPSTLPSTTPATSTRVNSTNAIIPVQNTNDSAGDPIGIPSCSANTTPTDKGESQPFSDWGDADSQDLEIPPETPTKVIRTPSKRRICETDKLVTDSNISPLKRSLAKLNF